MRKRIAKEIQHGRFLAAHGAGEIWNWESPAGKLRWTRRVKMLSSHLEHGMRVLEVGCGTGYFTRELARLGRTSQRLTSRLSFWKSPKPIVPCRMFVMKSRTLVR